MKENVLDDQHKDIGKKTAEEEPAAVYEHVPSAWASAWHIALDRFVCERDGKQEQREVQEAGMKQRADMHGDRD